VADLLGCHSVRPIVFDALFVCLYFVVEGKGIETEARVTLLNILKLGQYFLKTVAKIYQIPLFLCRLSLYVMFSDHKCRYFVHIGIVLNLYALSEASATLFHLLPIMELQLQL